MTFPLRAVGTAIGAFLAGAAAVVVILQWWNAPQGKLRATFTANAYQAAPSADTDSLPDFKDTTRPTVATFKKLIGFMNAFPIEAFLDGSVRNAGSKDLKHVVLTVPKVVNLCLKRSSKDWACQRSSEQITIGDLAPLEAVGVQLWLSSSPKPDLLNAITITHSEGVGKIAFEAVTVPASDSAAVLGWIVSLVIGFTVVVLVLQLTSLNKSLNKTLERLKDSGTRLGK